MLLAPFRLPDDFLADLGYPGERRFVGLHWTPLGDELCFDDGERSGCGICDHWLYRSLVRRPEVAAWLGDNAIHLGNSDEQAEHWLVVDGDTGEVYAAAWRDARLMESDRALPTRSLRAAAGSRPGRPPRTRRWKLWWWATRPGWGVVAG